jgi:hypothetical protein
VLVKARPTQENTATTARVRNMDGFIIEPPVLLSNGGIMP